MTHQNIEAKVHVQEKKSGGMLAILEMDIPHTYLTVATVMGEYMDRDEALYQQHLNEAAQEQPQPVPLQDNETRTYTELVPPSGYRIANLRGLRDKMWK